MVKSIGVIVSTYNDPTSLESCLQGLLRQTMKPRKVYIADDGSGTESHRVIQRFSRDILPIKHIWQKDQGFRKAQILNKAIARSTEEYLVFLDGDSVPHKKFIADHKKNARPGTVVLGQRCAIKGYYGKVLPRPPSPFKLFYLFCSGRVLNDNQRFGSGFKMKYRGFLKGLRSPKAICCCCTPNEARGGNLGVWSKDIININGFNEAFRGWGHEDIDLVMRLKKSGVAPMQLMFAGVCYHIDHPPNLENEANRSLLTENSPARCEIGLDQHMT